LVRYVTVSWLISERPSAGTRSLKSDFAAASIGLRSNPRVNWKTRQPGEFSIVSAFRLSRLASVSTVR